MRACHKLISTIILSGFLLQCSNSTEPVKDNPQPIRTPADLTAEEKSLVESSTRFSFKLFREIADNTHPDSNVFISPLSVSYALGMTHNGAAGETREKIAATLELADLSIEEINKSYQSLMKLLINLDQYVTTSIANSIWYRSGIPVMPEFVSLNQTFFDALVRELDFNASWAADTINQWVSENTNGKIKKIIQSPIDANIIIYLINAIYFKAAWTHPFDPDDTRTQPFNLSDSSQTECQMMAKDTILNYLETNLLQAVDLPYGDEKYYSMAVLLPRPSISIDELINSLEDNWSLWIAGFIERRIQLGLPKFKFEYETGLNQVLKALGMEIAFSPGAADFSNMISGGGVWIDTVIHKTFVQVDEEGTEAAAVTVVGGEISLPPQMVVNRPFLFVIYEKESGTILFMGKVANPVWEE